jgi:hypothetical protein
MRTAGRALAIDPTSGDAAALVSQLLLADPTEVPAEVETALEAEEQRLMRSRSRRAVLPYASIFVGIPLLPFLHIASYPMLVAVLVAFALMVSITYLNSRYGVPIWLTLIGHSFTALLFSRLLGPFVITPIMLCAILLSATSIPYLNRRPWAVLLWTSTTVLLPFALEWAGVLAPSWAMTPQGLLSFGNVFVQSHMMPGLIIGGHLAAVCLVAAYARIVGRDRRDAQRSLFLQAWRLRHLLPKTAA